ncbi:MAG: hypothetical protein ACLTOX_02825 [Streptococcus thermophilus]
MDLKVEKLATLAKNFEKQQKEIAKSRTLLIVILFVLYNQTCSARRNSREN